MTINISLTPTHWPTKRDKIKPNLKRQKQEKSKSQPIRDTQFKRERDLLRLDRLLKNKERDSFINFIQWDKERETERVREKNLEGGPDCWMEQRAPLHRSRGRVIYDLRWLIYDLRKFHFIFSFQWDKERETERESERKREKYLEGGSEGAPSTGVEAERSTMRGERRRRRRRRRASCGDVTVGYWVWFAGVWFWFVYWGFFFFFW